MSYFEKHLFFCTNQREDGTNACGKLGAQAAFEYAKKSLIAQGLHGEGKIRATRSGCLGRCNDGPVCVVYPQGTWYQYVDTSDIEEIIESDLKDNQKVDRLMLP